MDDQASLVDAVVDAVDAHHGRVLAVGPDAKDDEETLAVLAEEVGLGHSKTIGGVDALDELRAVPFQSGIEARSADLIARPFAGRGIDAFTPEIVDERDLTWA